MEHNFAFIDGQNLYESLNRKGINFSYEKLRKYLRNKYSVTKAILYLGDIHKDIYKKASRSGFEVKKKKAIKQIDSRGNIVMKANIDIDLVVGAIGEYWGKYDKAVIMSGDGDFLALVEYLKREGKLKAIIIPNKIHSASCYASDALTEYRVYLSDTEEKINLLTQ